MGRSTTSSSAMPQTVPAISRASRRSKRDCPFPFPVSPSTANVARDWRQSCLRLARSRPAPDVFILPAAQRAPAAPIFGCGPRSHAAKSFSPSNAREWHPTRSAIRTWGLLPSTSPPPAASRVTGRTGSRSKVTDAPWRPKTPAGLPGRSYPYRQQPVRLPGTSARAPTPRPRHCPG